VEGNRGSHTGMESDTDSEVRGPRTEHANRIRLLGPCLLSHTSTNHLPPQSHLFKPLLCCFPASVGASPFIALACQPPPPPFPWPLPSLCVCVGYKSSVPSNIGCLVSFSLLHSRGRELGCGVHGGGEGEGQEPRWRVPARAAVGVQGQARLSFSLFFGLCAC
jgi:hypothetical protein